MEKTMTLSTDSKTMTEGQIVKAVANYRALLEKHAGEFDSQAVQTVLGQPELADEQFAVFRHRVELVSEMIVREVEVDYDISPEEAIHATKRAEYLNDKVVAAMPLNGKGKKRVKVYFFPLCRVRGASETQKLIDEHGLKPDGYAVSAINEADPAFADSHPNGTQWEDEQGRHCYVTFGRWSDERGVLCNRHESVWGDVWWIGGVSK